ncbi:NAD(P)-dependent oxidoreductase [Acholeplasma laidlawii]|jgi:putative NADH-flavin reductase|uniref:NAD(P)-dependent oxidoreductase n=1 Tax=Acholeplasma laidlawii TaxID=2148 RepID=UPI0021F7A6DD|nr:NAD(P)H-binding protein [Acholeplasma laidlawii]
MKIAVIGASGFIGENIVNEALSKGHEVVGIFRRNSIPAQNNLTLKKLTIFDEADFEAAIKDCDVIVSAYNPGYYHVAQAERFLDGYKVIFNMAKKLNKHVIAVIGATTLIQYDGELVKDSLVFPKPWIKALEGTDRVFETYKGDTSLKVTFVSPAAEVFDGPLTKQYVYGKDHLIYDSLERSRISVKDLAHAIILECEHPKYVNSRFTIAYQN